MSRNRFIRKSLVSTAAVVSLVVTAAGPAAADEIAGAGGGVGGDYPSEAVLDMCPPNVLTARVDSYTLEIDHTGTYTGVDDDSNAIASYVGASHVTVTADDSHYISPLGTHDAACAVVPAAIPVTVTVTSPGKGGSGGTGTAAGVNCASTAGTLIRVQAAVRIEFSGECTVTGNQPLGQATVTAETRHELEGTLTPCAADPCAPSPFPQDDPGSIYEGTYEADSVR